MNHIYDFERIPSNTSSSGYFTHRFIGDDDYYEEKSWVKKNPKPWNTINARAYVDAAIDTSRLRKSRFYDELIKTRLVDHLLKIMDIFISIEQVVMRSIALLLTT